jgi:hypothetical protein
MTGVSHFTFRSTTPGNAPPPELNISKKLQGCWGYACPHMNQIIDIVNDKILEVYKRNPSTRVNYLDGWKLLGGYCLTDSCTVNGRMQCYTTRSAEYDDWYHSAYLAYVQIAPWLEHVCRNAGNSAAKGAYLS